jgi:glycosyltransferase involved in cell wall biosynthesis
MMACGLPVIEIDNESTRAIYPDDIVVFAEPSAEAIASKIQGLARNTELRDQLSKNALEWVQNTGWDKSFAHVSDFIKNEVLANTFSLALYSDYSQYYLSNKYSSRILNSVVLPDVSIVIPTYNGGPLLLKVIERVLQQNLDGRFELLIIDSSSDDGVIDDIPADQRISIYQIPKSSFQHGKTRNLGVALSKAPLIAFLTQDAIPYDERWLANLIKPFQRNRLVMAVFGRHLGHDEHPDFIKTALNEHFNSFSQQKFASKFDNLFRYHERDPRYRQSLHFYSDNNSCLRRTAWQIFPYPDVLYGEDQLWADWVVQWGYTKAYAEDAIVKHSHYFTPEEEFERSSIEAYFFLLFFGYNLSQNRVALELWLEGEAKNILQSCNSSISDYQAHLLAQLRAKQEGYQQGVATAINEFE